MTDLQRHLEDSFHLYIAELESCRWRGAYLGSLHLACAIPDVCGALETIDNYSTPASYMRWADRHLVKGDWKMLSRDWYRMRCAVLHHGSSVPSDKRDIKSQYGSFSFVTPQTADATVHRVIVGIEPNKNITLGIPQVAEELSNGLKDWFAWLHETSADASQARTNVLQHLRTVISPRPKTWPDLPHQGITWSSTGATPIIVVDVEE